MTATHARRSSTPRRRSTVTAQERHSAHNYHPLPVVVAEAEGAWVTDVDGRRYLDCLAGYSALNFGHRHPALVAAAHRAARPAHAHQPGVRQRPVRRRSARALAELCGKEHGAADEHRRRGGRDGDQGGPQVGLRGARGAGRPGAHRGRGGRVPRPHHHDRRLLDRPGRPGGFGPFTPGFDVVPTATPTRSRRDRPGHGGRAARADPGRGRGGRAAAGLPGRGPADLRPTQRAVHRRRGAVGPRPHRGTCSPRPRGRRRRRLPAGQGAGRRHRAGVGGGRGRRRARGAAPRPARQDLRRQPAGLRGRQRGGRPAGRSGRARPRPVGLGRVLAAGSTSWWGTASSRFARRALGGDRRRPPAGQRPRRVQRRWPAAACWPRTPTARRSASSPPLVATADELALAVDALAAVLTDLRCLPPGVHDADGVRSPSRVTTQDSRSMGASPAFAAVCAAYRCGSASVRESDVAHPGGGRGQVRNGRLSGPASESSSGRRAPNRGSASAPR